MRGIIRSALICGWSLCAMLGLALLPIPLL